VNEALLQKRASSLGFEGSVEQVLFFFAASRSPVDFLFHFKQILSLVVQS
jgi:hypothetical protein